MSETWDPRAQPVYQTTDTFQQLTDKLNSGRTNLDSDLSYLDSAIGPLTAGSTFALTGITTTAKSLIDSINEIDAELGIITSDAMGTTSSTVSTAIAEHGGELGTITSVAMGTTASTVSTAILELGANITTVNARIPNVYNAAGTLLNP